MGDRLDIDALLIGSLYGELNAADEARLQAHLESHPGDRAALASLTRARELLHESRYLQVQLEPPQAISALLLQQAAQHAPKVKAVAVETEREGWFARFVRAFVGHPAMAAATMLVLVLGVAGALYMRKGDHFAEPTAPRPTTADKINTQPLDGEQQQERSKLQQEKLESYKAELNSDPAPAQAQAPADKKFGGNATAAPDRMVAPSRVLEAKTSSGPTPKELDDEKASPPRDESVKADVPKRPDTAPAMPPSTAPRAQAEGAGRSADADTIALEKETRNRGAVPGNAQAPRTGTTPPAPPASMGSGSAAATVARNESEQQGETLAWAKQQHQKLVAETQRNQCEAAAATAVAISLRAPGYFQQNVEADRSLKQCIAYINRAREAEAEMRARQSRGKRLEDPAPAKAAAPAADKR